MRIIINALQYKRNSSGIGICIRELFGKLIATSNRACVIVLSKDSPFFPAGEMATYIRSPWDNEQKLRRFLFQSIRMGLVYCKNALFLTTDSKAPLFLTRSFSVMPLVTDLALYRLPDTYQKSRVTLWKVQYRILVKRAVHWLAISEFTKREMMELFNIREEDIDVVYMAASENYRRVTDTETLVSVKERYKLPERYILFVGNFNPRKNLDRLIRAYDIFKTHTGLPHELVIAGEYGWRFDQSDVMAGIINRNDIQFLGYAKDDDMPALYSMADLFAFPTLYEGFGMPVLEAQRCGTPVLTSDISALPEVAGNGALYVDPYNVEEISGAFEKLLTDKELAGKLVAAGYENASKFSWASSAIRLNEIIESVINDGLHENI